MKQSLVGFRSTGGKATASGLRFKIAPSVEAPNIPKYAGSAKEAINILRKLAFIVKSKSKDKFPPNTKVTPVYRCIK